MLMVMLSGSFSQCSTGDPKYKLYYIEGQKLYAAHCSNCHQSDGQGLRKVYPPLAGSDYMSRNYDQVLCGMKYGMQGEITVNGVMYRQPMPGVRSLNELEIAEISTYIYNSWGNEKGLIDVKGIAATLERCESR
jgi:cytochrome c551